MILDVEMNPSKVDVNVHPAKLEVRFENEDVVFKAMYHAVKDTLLRANLISDREKTKEAHAYSKDAFKIQSGFTKGLGSLFKKKEDEEVSNMQIAPQNDMSNSNINEEKTNDNIDIDYKSDENNIIQEEADDMNISKDDGLLEGLNIPNNEEERNISDKGENIIDANNNENTNIQKTDNVEVIEKNEPKTFQEKIEEEISFREMYKQLFGKEPYGGRVEEKISKEDKKDEDKYYKIDEEISDNNSVSMFEDMEEYKTIPYKFIGIAFNTYIILEIENELYIMDQHAAHERILYEKVKKNFNSGNKNNSQLLLLPDIITLTHKEMSLAKENFPMFEKAGFILEEFGENTIKLSGVPDICVELDTKELFMETLDEINTVARTAKQEKEERFIATVACKAAVKANMKLNKEEVDNLMAELLKLPNPFSCPHGRPTVIKMSRYDIDKKFERT